MSLPPRGDLDAKGLEAFRGLSARSKGMAEGRGHQFVGVEQALWPETAVSSQPAPASQTAAALAPGGMWESDKVHISTNAMMARRHGCRMGASRERVDCTECQRFVS